MPTIPARTVLQWAMEIERNGEAFYRAVAAHSADREAKLLFDDLAHQEQRHYRTFERMFEKAPEVEGGDATVDYQRYLETALSGALAGPNRGLEQAREAENEADALRAAMAFEKDTLLFFYDLMDAVPESQKDAVRAVIDEERDHLRQLSRVLQNGTWVP